MRIVETAEGNSPLVLSMPHCGTALPSDIAERLNERGRAIGDTDWWIHRLYDFGDDFGATVVRANLSRYVIDLNRDPFGKSLYPGQATTGLCPVETFDGTPLYRPGEEPSAAEVEARRKKYFAPYHQALGQALTRAKAKHGYALLYDCHSIRSVVPRLFDGPLPMVNIGTNSGASCAPALETAVVGACEHQSEFGYVCNARFKGGWITRHYGQPESGIHAIQVELAQAAYMNERPPWDFDDDKADRLRVLLRAMLHAYLGVARKTLERQS